jgi:hypothetical protein
MKTIAPLVLVAAFALLGSCAINPHPMDMTRAVQSATTRSDHDALAKHYEDAAKEMRANADEHKKMLAQYQAKKDIYGKHAQDLMNHCQGLIRIYDQAAAENIAMAKSHREMAAEAK